MDILINDLLRIFNYNVTVDTIWDQQQAKERITSKSPKKMIQEEKQEVVAKLICGCLNLRKNQFLMTSIF